MAIIWNWVLLFLYPRILIPIASLNNMAISPRYSLDSIGSFYIKKSTFPNGNPSRIFTSVFSFRIINLNNVACLKTIDLFLARTMTSRETKGID
jgi:hypothetical protein